MGRGDARTKRGKIFRGSYGVSRLKKQKKTTTVTPATPVQRPVENPPATETPAQ